MNKKGYDMSLIHVIYLVIGLIILISALGKIYMNKDDTGYYLEYYSKDLSVGIEAFLQSDIEGSFVYGLREGFEVKIDNSEGKVYVKNDNAIVDDDFRTRDGFFINLKTEENNLIINKREATV